MRVLERKNMDLFYLMDLILSKFEATEKNQNIRFVDIEICSQNLSIHKRTESLLDSKLLT